MTRSRFITLFTALAASLAITIPVLASHADDGRSRVQPLAATMRGAAEVPPVDSDATGNIMFYVDVKAHSLCFELTTGIPAGDVTGLHIHRAAAGENGGIAVFLQGDDFTGPSWYHQCSASVERPLLNEIAKKPGRFYANLHTAANPGGELRGQLGHLKVRSTP